MNDIKPCPCCGREAKSFQDNEYCWGIQCGSCFILIESDFVSKEEAIKQWNRIVSVKPVLTNGMRKKLEERLYNYFENGCEYICNEDIVETVRIVEEVLKGE